MSGQCEAWGLILANGDDPGLVDVAGLTLDERIWAEPGSAVLCHQHTARIRSLTHGGVLFASSLLPPSGAAPGGGG